MNRLSTRMKALLFLSGLILLYGAGCSNKNDDDAPGAQQASNEDMEDIAEDFGSALASDDEGMLGMWDNSDGGNFSFNDRDRENTLDDTLIIEHQGFTIVRVRDFFDANDVWSGLYLPGITARMEQALSVEGTHESNSGNRSVTIAHHDSIEVSGLLPTNEVRTVDGNGERNVEGEFHSRFHQNVRTFESHYDWIVTDIELHNNWVEYPYPLGGTIGVNGYWINTHTNPGRDVTQSVSFSFVITFDGTRYARLVFTGGGTFWIDLANGWCSHDRPGDEG